VLEQIDRRASRRPDDSLSYSRQKVARFLQPNAETRVGGFDLAQRLEGPYSKPIARYLQAHAQRGGLIELAG
jgi:hypothetical protein